MARKGRRPTDAERAERRRRERERLEQATAELLTSEGWRRWLRARSVLHGYSLQNTLLIAQQCHARGIEPTYVAGFRAWLRLGRVVRKGQTGLRIWAPMRIKARDEDGEESEERKLRFRSATVFDVSQTEPLPDVEPAPLSPPGATGSAANRTPISCPRSSSSRPTAATPSAGQRSSPAPPRGAAAGASGRSRCSPACRPTTASRSLSTSSVTRLSESAAS